MLSGMRDEIVPKEHMAELEALLREVPGKGRRPGRIVEFPDGMHSEWWFFLVVIYVSNKYTYEDNTCVQAGYWEEIVTFMSS